MKDNILYYFTKKVLQLWQFGALQERPTQSLHVAGVSVGEVLSRLSGNNENVGTFGLRCDDDCGSLRPAHCPGGVDFVYEVDHL